MWVQSGNRKWLPVLAAGKQELPGTRGSVRGCRGPKDGTHTLPHLKGQASSSPGSSSQPSLPLHTTAPD